MSLLKKLAGETAIYGASYILPKVLHYVVITSYLTRVFNEQPEQYGFYTSFYFWVAFLLVLLTMRMETTFFRYGHKKENRDTAFSTAATNLIVTALGWGILVSIFKDQIAAMMDYPNMGRHVFVLGLVLVLDILAAVPFARLRLENRPLRFAMIKIGGVVLNVGLILFFLEVVPHMGSESVFRLFSEKDQLLYVFLSNLIASGLVLILLSPQYFKVKWVWDQVLWKKMIKYSWPLIIVGLAGVINQSGYIVFLQYLLPNDLIANLSDGGIYAAAARIAVLMSLFTTAFNYAAEPFFFQHSEKRDTMELYAKVAQAFSIAGAILFVLILLYLDIIQLIVGKNFRSGLAVVPILLMAFFFLGLYYNFSIWYKIKDKTHIGAFISIAGAFITIALNVILIQSTGDTISSAWAALACYVFMALACYFIGKKYFPVPYALGRIFSHIGLALFIYWASEWIRPFLGGNIGLILAANTGLVLLFLAVMYRSERSLIREFRSGGGVG